MQFFRRQPLCCIQAEFKLGDSLLVSEEGIGALLDLECVPYTQSLGLDQYHLESVKVTMNMQMK